MKKVSEQQHHKPLLCRHHHHHHQETYKASLIMTRFFFDINKGLQFTRPPVYDMMVEYIGVTQARAYEKKTKNIRYWNIEGL